MEKSVAEGVYSNFILFPIVKEEEEEDGEEDGEGFIVSPSGRMYPE